MKPIRFRGKNADGEIITSDSIKFEEITFARISAPYLFDKENKEWIAVYPDSVAQLIGFDKNDNEIYEGDEIRSHFGQTCLATFRRFGLIDDGAYTLNKSRITD